MSDVGIYQRLFNFIPDNELKLGNAAYVRRFNIGNNWSRIRIGILAAIANTSSQNFLHNGFYLGLGSSAASPISSYRNVNFIGLSIFPTGTATYNANSGYPCFTGIANLIRRLDQTNLVSITGATTAAIAKAYTGLRNRRTPIVLDITRPQGGGGAYTLTAYTCSTTTVQVDFRPDHLWQAVDALGTPVVYGQTLTSWVTSAVVFSSETFGKFDQLELYYENTVNPLEVYAIGGAVVFPGYYEDVFGGAYDDFRYWTASSGSLAGTIAMIGTGWGSIEGTLVSYGNPYATTISAYPGTALRYPHENFESYAEGTQTSGFNAGTNWATDGTVV